MIFPEKLDCNVNTKCLTIDVKMTDEKRREFGQLLKKERELSGLKQNFVAEKTGIDVVHLSRLENGHSGTKRDTLIEIIRTINKYSGTGYQIDEKELLNKAGYSSEIGNEDVLFKEFQEIDFDLLSDDEKREIIEFAKFKEYRARVRNSESPADRFEFEREWRERMEKENRAKK